MKKIILFFVLFMIPKLCFATSTVVMDVDSGRVLYENKKDNVQLIASITKIMTCIIVLENDNLNDIVKVGDEVLKMYGTNIYIEVGEEISVKDLLYGMMLRSGNDAALSLSYHTFASEEEFVNKMNEKAKEIGMINTIFSNPHGLDEDTKNYSTAYDMALLSRYAYQNSEYLKIISTKKYQAKSSLKTYTWYNRMSLLNNYKNCIGGKNGYTPKAGKTLVSLARYNDLTLTIVTLDDGNLYEHHKNLYEEFFKKYNNYTIIDKDTFTINFSLIEGKYYINNSFIYPLLDNELDDIKTVVLIYNKSKKNNYGSIVISFRNKEIGRIPIYRRKEKSIPKKGLLSKITNLIGGKN